MIELLISRLLGPRLASRIVPWLCLLLLGLSCYWLAQIFGATAKIETWLFWSYASVWCWCVLFTASCLSVGNWLVGLLLPSAERDVEHLTLSFATGVLAFFASTAAVGFAHLYGKVAFFAIPLVLLGLGARQATRDLLVVRARWRAEPGWLSLRPVELVAFAVGAVALFILYLGVLVPENAAYDSRWYHLALAENYATAGGITRSVEGAATSTVPHLTSVLYTWAFCLPWGGLFQRVELAAHLEFVIFVLKLPGLVALVRYLVPGARANAAWLSLFVFPSIFLYDSSLHAASDHIAALWTIPTYLTFVRAYTRLEWKACLLFAAQVSGLLLSKYTAAIAVAGPVLVLTLRGLWLTGVSLWRGPRTFAPLYSLFATLSAGVVMTSPHWLKNLVWHGDPVYPILHKHLAVRPWNSGASYLFEVYQSVAWAATGTTAEKLEGMKNALYDHSYALYNWADFHGPYPVFGSLFTFSLVVLPLLSGTRRVWALTLMTHLGIAMWFWLFHNERYLQSVVPWMAATVASLAILAWRSGWAARLGVVALGGLQIVWGLDMVFWPLHRMTGKSQVGLANDFFARGYGGNGADRLKPFEDFAKLGRALPRGAKVLIHHEHTRLGLNAPSVSDAPRIQYGINYAELGSPANVGRWFRENGITHVVWQPTLVFGEEPIGAELVFHAYAASFSIIERSGGRALGQLPAQPPRPRSDEALVFLCDATYQPGIYRVSALNVSPYPLAGFTKVYPAPQRTVSPNDDMGFGGLGYAVVNSACPGAPHVPPAFRLTAATGTVRFYVQN